MQTHMHTRTQEESIVKNTTAPVGIFEQTVKDVGQRFNFDMKIQQAKVMQ